MEWYVIVNDDNLVLAVYGSAFVLSEVQDKARQIEYQSGLPVWLNKVTGNRPSVGQTITFRRDKGNV